MEFREKLKEDLAIFRQRLIWLEDGTMRSYDYSRGQQMDRIPDAVDYTKRIIAEIEKCLAEHSERRGQERVGEDFMCTNPKSRDYNTLATDRSGPDKVKPSPFEDRRDAGPIRGNEQKGDDPRDAGEIAKQKHGSRNTNEALPGAIPPEKLTTETDDGAA